MDVHVKGMVFMARHIYPGMVARGGGRHAFSETFDEHNAAIKESNARRTPP